MGIAAFITEISSPEQRTFRLAMIHFVGSLGRPIGTKVSLSHFTIRFQCPHLMEIHILVKINFVVIYEIFNGEEFSQKFGMHLLF